MQRAPSHLTVQRLAPGVAVLRQADAEGTVVVISRRGRPLARLMLRRNRRVFRPRPTHAGAPRTTMTLDEAAGSVPALAHPRAKELVEGRVREERVAKVLAELADR